MKYVLLFLVLMFGFLAESRTYQKPAIKQIFYQKTIFNLAGGQPTTLDVYTVPSGVYAEVQLFAVECPNANANTFSYLIRVPAATSGGGTVTDISTPTPTATCSTSMNIFSATAVSDSNPISARKVDGSLSGIGPFVMTTGEMLRVTVNNVGFTPYNIYVKVTEFNLSNL